MNDRAIAPMPVPFVLVHSPLIGATAWEPVAGALRERGHEVLLPDLAESLADGPPYWSRQVDTITAAVAGRQVVLVAHSGAGPLLAPAGEGLDRVEGYVFVDAGLPFPEQSWMDTAPQELADQMRAMAIDGWLPPWSEWWGADALAEMLPEPAVRERFAAGCPRLPIAMFEEAHPPAPGWPNAPCGYLRLSEAYADPAARADALGWPVIEFPSHHLSLLTDAGRLVGSLLELVRELRRATPT